jgi:MATE family multidrug resistance protein
MLDETTPPSPRAAGAGRLSEVGPLISLSVPLVTGLTTSTLPALIDTFMLGPLGATVLGAVALTSSVLLIFYAGLYGFVGPVGILIGQAHGAQEPGRIAAIIQHGMAIALLAGLLSAGVMALGLAAIPWIGQPPEVLAIITPYWVAMSLSLIPYTILLVFKQFYDSIDRPWLAVWFMLVGVVGNIILNWLLIYGNLGFPALGMLGAGIGSLLGQVIALATMAAHYSFARSTAPYRGSGPWSLSAFRVQVREGTPMALQYVLEGGALALAGLMIGWLGATALAANQIVQSVTSVLYMLPLGMAGAVSIRVSQAAGAGAHGRLPAIAYTALGLVSIWMLSFTVLLVLVGEGVALLFVSDPAVVLVAAVAFVAVGLMQILDGIQSVSLGALRGILDNDWPTGVSLVGYWVIAMPAGYFAGFVLDWGVAGVWVGFGVGLLVASVLLVWRLRFQFRRLSQRES